MLGKRCKVAQERAGNGTELRIWGNKAKQWLESICIRIPCVGERVRKEMRELRPGVWRGRAREGCTCMEEILDARTLNRVPGIKSHTKWLNGIV